MRGTTNLGTTLKSILIYLFSILVSGIILALGLDAINQKVNEAVLVDTNETVTINDIN